MRWFPGFPTVFALLIVAPAAHAVDGVLEINQACAVNTGCFAGDTAGFPVTITASGSYRLTGNLDGSGDGSGTGPSVMTVTAAGVTLDLNGFEVVSDTSEAITSTGGTTVANGTIRDVGLGGIRAMNLGDGSVVHRVKVEGTYILSINFDGSGIVELGEYCRVTDSIVTAHGRGVFGGSSCYVARNVINNFSGDGGRGITVGWDSTVVNNTVAFAEGNIRAGPDSTIIGNTASNAALGTGISAGEGSVITDNTVNYNATGLVCAGGCTLRGNVASGNSDVGIRCPDCVVIGNVANDNDGLGFSDTSGTSGYSNNQFNNNNGGNGNPQVSGGIEMGTNICGGDSTCP